MKLQLHFFSVDPTPLCCGTCGGISIYIGTASCLANFNSVSAPSNDFLASSFQSTSITTKHRIEYGSKKHALILKKFKKKVKCSPLLLQDITNNMHVHLMQETIWLDDDKLRSVTQVNHMLSELVVPYFFKIIAQSFRNILHTEFLFDFVKWDHGGWNHCHKQ